MPATENTWRDQRVLHVVFGFSSLAMLLATLWMFAKDHDREWKRYQRQYNDVEKTLTQWQLRAETRRLASSQRDEILKEMAEQASTLPDPVVIDALVQEVERDAQQRGAAPPRLTRLQQYLSDVAAGKEFSDPAAVRQKLLHGSARSGGSLMSIFDEAKYRENQLVRARKFRAADYDAAKATLDLMIRDGALQSDQSEAQKKADAIRHELDELTRQRERATAHRLRLAEILHQVQGREEELSKALADLEQEANRLRETVAERSSTFFTGTFPFLGKRWLELPILDAFNSPLKIDNLWTEDLKLVNGSFGQVRRFDRCTTCHRGIDKAAAGSTDPAFVLTHDVRMRITPSDRTNTSPEDVPTLESVYGITLAPQGVVGRNDVTISDVEPKSPAAMAVAVGDHTLIGLQPGDVIFSVNGDRVYSIADARRFLLGSQAVGKTHELLIKRGLPHPYVSHPRLDLFVGSLSPHKLAVFRCTSCHEGQGTATAFANASHAPNSLEQAEQWSREHGWFNNPHWIYPMYPRRFMESTCLRCHHHVVELEPSERFPDPPAPTLMKGYHLVADYGCFGCHEINGYGSGGQRIGPDLRLEPNFFAVAAALVADPGFADAPRSVQEDARTLVQHPDRDQERHRLHEYLTQAQQSGESKLSQDSLALSDQLQDVEQPGTLRKVGPSLRFVGSKLDAPFLYDWIREPKHFRPSTRMPQFFGQWRHLEAEPESKHRSQRWEPIEILGLVTYLLDKSQPFAPIPAEGKVEKASAERGKSAFELRGCLACHQHADFPAGKATHGPNLSNLGDKFATLADPKKGRAWLYSWLKQPQHYSPRTKMPNLYLDPQEVDGKLVDPAADIAEYLLSSSENWKPAAESTAALLPDAAALDEVVFSYLRSTFSEDEARDYVARGIPRSAGVTLAMSERELVENASQNAKLNYIGRRTIAKYGCYACHDIPGFEAAKPIGTALADWGRKEASKLAFEHINEYLGIGHHGAHATAAHDEDHGEHSSSTSAATTAPFYAAEREDRADEEYFHLQLKFQDRSGFLWQKLREPRSYDFLKTLNKSYHEQLRMPLFPFDESEREAVMTFVLGLVAEPPNPRFVYEPDPRSKAIQEGLVVLNTYNCQGCHILDGERWELDFEPGTFEEPATLADFPFVQPRPDKKELATSATPNPHTGRLRATVHGLSAISNEDGKIEVWDEDGDPIDPEEEYDPLTLQHPFDLWANAAIEGNLFEVGVSNLVVPASAVRQQYGANGGDLTYLLLPRVVELEKEVNPGANGKEAWGWLPPPLMGQGRKVQSKWLHDFLLNPFPIRPAVFLRMPNFHMSPDDARRLTNYFAAKDNLLSPFGYESPVTAEALRQAEEQFVSQHETSDSRFDHAMSIIADGNYCIKCHLVGDFRPEGSERALAPNLADVQSRLRSTYTQHWIANPKRILPYSNMPVNIPYDHSAEHLGGVAQSLFPGTSIEQLDGVVDLLLNFDRYAIQQSNLAELIRKKSAGSAQVETSRAPEPSALRQAERSRGGAGRTD